MNIATLHGTLMLWVTKLPHMVSAPLTPLATVMYAWIG